MLLKNSPNGLASGEIVRRFHKSKVYLTKIVILLTVLIFAVAATVTFYICMNFSSESVAGIVIVPAIFTIISAITSFVVTPRCFFVLAVLFGIDAGAILRCVLIPG